MSNGDNLNTLLLEILLEVVGELREQRQMIQDLTLRVEKLETGSGNSQE